MPRLKRVYAWIEGNAICASVAPRAEHHAVNRYDAPDQVLVDASARKMTVEWEDIEAIDRWQTHLS